MPETDRAQPEGQITVLCRTMPKVRPVPAVAPSHTADRCPVPRMQKPPRQSIARREGLLRFPALTHSYSNRPSSSFRHSTRTRRTSALLTTSHLLSILIRRGSHCPDLRILRATPVCRLKSTQSIFTPPSAPTKRHFRVSDVR